MSKKFGMFSLLSIFAVPKIKKCSVNVKKIWNVFSFIYLCSPKNQATSCTDVLERQCCQKVRKKWI